MSRWPFIFLSLWLTLAHAAPPQVLTFYYDPQVAMIGLNIIPVALEAAPEEALVEEHINIPFYGVQNEAPLYV